MLLYNLRLLLAAYRPVSIKRPDLNFLKKSLFNVRYDRKNECLNILSYRSYNRVVRVRPRNRQVLDSVCTWADDCHKNLPYPLLNFGSEN